MKYFSFYLKENICIKNKCIKCCIQTSMILTYKDIEKINKLGYNKNFFISFKNGWINLKNKYGRCVFHNGLKCIIYNSRPEGCRLYPLIFDNIYKSANLDSECPYKEYFNFDLKDNKKLYNLIKRLKSERQINKK
jgi:Fe-S-cluster containining protein